MNEVIEKEPERYYYRYEEIDEPVIEKVQLAAEPIGSSENVVELETLSPRVGFFGRRFRHDQGWGQMAFDLMFGVALPVVCFVLDPFIFRNQPDGRAVLGGYTYFAYSLAFVTIVATMVSLIFGKKLGTVNAALSGLFGVSGVIALVVGLAILPLTIVGMGFLSQVGPIVILGFTPLISTFVMLRRSVVTFRATTAITDQMAAVNLFLLSALTSIVVPFLINVEFRGSSLSTFFARIGISLW